MRSPLRACARAAVQPGVNVQPAEEDVAGGLHEPLSGDDALAVIRELAGPEEGLEPRGLGFLDLQEKRILVVAAQQQGDPRAGADASDPDDLAGEVVQLELLEQHAAVELQHGEIFPQKPMELLEDLTS